MIEPCNLFKQIPLDKLNTYFDVIEEASAELDLSFLAFEECYEEALKYTNEDTIILDFGCAYALQSWFFPHCKEYIGVEGWMQEGLPFAQKAGCFPDNVTLIHQTIQDYISDFQDFDYDLHKVIAICSAVPDKEARELVRETFPNYIDWYPGEEMNVHINQSPVISK